MSPVLDIRNLSKNFGSIEILKNINISIDEGDFLVLVGPLDAGNRPCSIALRGWSPSAMVGLRSAGKI